MNFCRECKAGYESWPGESIAQQVEECPDVECHKWPWRTGVFTPDDPKLWEVVNRRIEKFGK